MPPRRFDFLSDYRRDFRFFIFAFLRYLMTFHLPIIAMPLLSRCRHAAADYIYAVFTADAFLHFSAYLMPLSLRFPLLMPLLFISLFCA